MSNAGDGSDLLHFLQAYKQWESQRGCSTSTGSQQPPTQNYFTVPQQSFSKRPRPRPQVQPPFRQPSRNPAELLGAFRDIEELKKRMDEIYAAITSLQTTAEQIKGTVEEGVAAMNGTMERFEVIGRGVIEMALQPNIESPGGLQANSSNAAPLNQQIPPPSVSSNPQNFRPGPNANQPTSTQSLFNPPPSQEPYTEPYGDYAFEFLSNGAT